MTATLSPYRTIKVKRPVRFDIVIDPAADDPVARSLCQTTASFLRRWFWPPRHSLPHLDLFLPLVRPGDNVLDLGAHLGTFSLAAAAAGCNVLAVEASPRNTALLEESVRRNRFERMRVVQAAASDRSGTIDFCPFGPFGHIATPATQLPRMPIRALRIDDLLDEIGWRKVAFIKMDIEGSELAAVRGMTRLLGRPDAPPVLFESNAYALGFYDATPALLLSTLEQFGYRIYRADARRRTSVAPDDMQPEVVIDYLAAKRIPDAFPAWKIETPATQAERAARLAKALDSIDPLQKEHVRGEIARVRERLAADKPAKSSIRFPRGYDQDLPIDT